VIWRPFLHEELRLATGLVQQGADECCEPAPEGLHECWAELRSSGLSFELLVYAQIVTFCAEDRYMVLKQLPSTERCLPRGEAPQLHGLVFYRISPELESSVRTLQTTDAATWPAFHGVRVGMTSTGAITAHAPEMLSGEKAVGRTSSLRSLGFGPCKANARNLLASASSDNAFSSTLRSMAVLRDYGNWMLEDSMPCSETAFRHDVRRGFLLSFALPDHWGECPCLSFRTALRDRVSRSPAAAFHKDVDAFLDDGTGIVKDGSYLVRGQALCFLPAWKDAPKEEDRRSYVYLAPEDLWVLKAEARVERERTSLCVSWF
jgi:hypothetical protein